MRPHSSERVGPFRAPRRRARLQHDNSRRLRHSGATPAEPAERAPHWLVSIWNRSNSPLSSSMGPTVPSLMSGDARYLSRSTCHGRSVAPLPLATAIPPIFIRVRDLGLLDTYWGVVLPQVAFSLAISVLLLRNAFKQLPGELLDAPLMNGCDYSLYFFYITLPLSAPILSTVAVITFVDSWNAFLLPLIVLNSEPAIAGPLVSWPIRVTIRSVAIGARLHHADDPARLEMDRRQPDRGRGQVVSKRRCPHGVDVRRTVFESNWGSSTRRATAFSQTGSTRRGLATQPTQSSVFACRLAG